MKAAAFRSLSFDSLYLPDNYSIRKEIGLTPKTEMGKAVISKNHPVNLSALEQMNEKLLLKGYSPNVILNMIESTE